MNKKSKVLVGVLAGLVAFLLLLEIITPQPLNWRESYTGTDKIPFGAHVFYDQLDELFKGQTVETVDTDPTQFFKKHKSLTNGNYIFINDYIALDKSELDDALDFVKRGNKLFISSKSAFGPLADTLKIASNTSYEYYSDDTVRVRLNNKAFKNRSYVYTRGSEYSYLEKYDTTRTKVLGEVLPFEPIKGYFKKVLGNTQATDSTNENSAQNKFIKAAVEKSKNRRVPQVNYVEVKVGKGAIYYHLNPIAFTNYYMLQPGKENYVAETMSYLNDGPVFFDNYGKSGRRVITSPMRFILSQPALKWAWYLMLASIVLYFVFKARREQRAIPLITPLENSSVEFTRTIGNMHFQSSNYTGIINKRIDYFLDHVRTTMYLDCSRLDASFVNKLSVKASVPLDKAQELVNTIIFLRHDGPHSEAQLQQLNRRIDAFIKE